MNMPVALPSLPDGQGEPSAVEGVITTVKYTQVQSDGGGAVTGEMFRHPEDVAVASDGSLFIAAYSGHQVWKVAPDGMLSLVAGDGGEGSGGDNGDATKAQLHLPGGLAFDAEGNLYIADTDRVRKVSPDGKITLVADGLRWPRGLACDGAGNLYIAERDRHQVLKVAPDGNITRAAGVGQRNWGRYERGQSEDGGQASASLLNGPRGVCVDEDGNLYIADTSNHRVKKVDREGVMTTILGVSKPTAVVRDIDGSLYVSDGVKRRVWKMDPDGFVTAVAGTGRDNTDGENVQATKAGLRSPYGLALDQYGNLYIADGYGYRVRKVAGPRERSLLIRQVKVPQASLGKTVELIVEITAYRPGQAVDAGVVVHTFTAPKGFVFADGPTYSYNGNDALKGSLGTRFEQDRSVMVVTHPLRLNTCTEDKGPLIYTIPIKAVTAVPPGTYHDGKLVVGRHPGIRLSGTIIEGPQFSVTPGGSPKELVRGSNECGYPGVEVRQGGPVPAQTITATLPPGAGLAFKPECEGKHQMTVGSRGGDKERSFDAELTDDAQTLTCQNVDLDFLPQYPNSRVWVAVTATVTATTGTPRQLTFRVGGIESASTTIKVVDK
ncbi:hypothetical protein [Streptomyces sp. MH13]|uniref:NHL domain-containing protein n=1 Tax=Streptomyces sp. MH13 TaxID=3417651 RepID=UPI003CEA2BD5